MAEIQKVQIVDSTNTPPPTWATEKTLSEIKALQSGSVALLKKIAKADDEFGNDIDSLINSVKTGNKERKEGQHASAEQSKTLINRVERGFNAIKTVLNINLDNIQAPFDLAGSSLNRFSRDLKDSSPEWSKWTGRLGLGVVIFGELFSAIQKTNESMLKLYGNGIVVQNGFSGLADGAMGVGLSFTEFTEVLTKNATVAVSLGTKRTMGLATMFAKATGEGSQLLMTSKESQEALFDTLETARSLGVLRNMNDTQVNNFTVEYLKNINELSEATGKSRDEIRKQTLQAAKSVDTFSALNQLTADQRKFMTGASTTLIAQFGEQTGGILTQSLGRYMSRGMSGIDPSMRLMMSRLGGGMGDAFNEMAQAGKIGDTAGFKRANEKFIASIENMTDEQAKLLDIQAQHGTGQAKEWARNLLAMRQSTQAMQDKKAADLEADQKELQRRQKLGESTLTLKQVTDDRIKKEDAAKKSIEDSTRAYSRARKAIADMQTTMYKFIEAIAPVLLPVLEALADTIIFLTKSFNSLFNGLKSVLSPIMGDKGSGIAAFVTTAAIAVIIKKVLGIMAVGAAKGVAGAAGAAGLGLFKGVTGMGGLAAGAAGLAGGLAGGAKSVLGSVAKKIPGLGVLLGLGMGAMDVANVNKQEKAGEISATDASRGRGSAVGGMAGTAIGAVLGTFIGGPVGTVIGGIIGEQLGSRIGEYWPEIKESFQSFSDFVGNIATTMKDTIGNTVDWIGEKWNSATDAVKGFVTGVVENVTKGLSWIGDTVGNTFGKARDLIGTAWNGVTSFMGNTAMPAAGAVGAAYNWASKQFGSQSTSTAASTTGPTTPVITADQLSVRTLKYYDDSMASMLSMVEKLETLHSDLELLRLNADIASSRLIDTIQRSGQVVK